MKKVCVSVVGSGQLHEITIQPGTTAGDILRDLNLPDYLLSSSPSAEFFASSESVYEKVADGQKLFASTKAIVGAELLDRLREAVGKYFPTSQAQVMTRTSPTILKRIVHSTPVRRRKLPYWMEVGWSKEGNIYRGNYQTRFGAFQGWVEEQSPRNIRFYIFDPPRQVLISSHAPCFQPRNDNWFHIHMANPPKDVSSGIVAIERLIAECCKGR